MVALNDILSCKADILRLAEQHGASHVRVFGSVVRDAAKPTSDLDLLVRMDSKRSLVDRIALKHDLEDLLGCEVDVINENALDPKIRDHVHAELVSL